MPVKTRDGSRRRVVPLGVFVLTAAVAVLVLRQLQSRDDARGLRATPHGERAHDEVPQGELAAAVDRLLRGMPPQGPNSVAAHPGERGIAGFVIDHSNGQPIPAALVYWSRPEELYAMDGAGWPSATTDDAGRFTLGIPSDDEIHETLVIIAVKNGYSAGKASVATNPLPDEPLMITLTQGLRRAGTVRTSSGRAVAGAAVVFAGSHARTLNSRVGLRLGDRALDGSLCVARTDDAGRFDVGGLMPEEVYLVQAEKEGFVVPRGAAQYIECRPASGDALELSLDPLVGVWLQCRDRESGVPISTWGGVSVIDAPSGGHEMTPWYPSNDPTAWSGQHPWHPGEFRVVYSVPDPMLLDSDARAVTVRITKPGFEDLVASIPLRLVTEWRGGTPTVVELARRPIAGFGTVRLRIREFPRAERPNFIPLVLRAGESTFIQSAMWNTREQLYESRLVPAGEYTLADFEGGGVVRIDRGAVVDVTVSFPRISNASLRLVLVDQARRALTYASVALIAEDGRVVASWEPRMAFQDGRQEINSLEPGRYDIVIYKPGFMQATRTVDVVAGSRNEIEIVLVQDNG